MDLVTNYEDKIQLKIVRIAGSGTADISAYWQTWAWHHDYTLDTGPGWAWATVAKASFSPLDVDIDADNNAGQFGGPDHTDQEEYLEHNPYGLGKIIVPNWGDTDGDGVPDCWDGYGFPDAYPGHDNDGSSAPFVPMTIQVPAGIDRNKATIEFDYDMIGAQPALNGTSLLQDNNGKIRIWRLNGNERRGGAFVSDDPQAWGDLIETNRPIKLADLYTADGYVKVYVEGVVEANFVQNYADVKTHNRPTSTIVVKLSSPNGATATDSVQYIVADRTSFYYHLQDQPELRAAFACDGIYTRADLQKYCLQLLGYDQLLAGCGFPAADARFLSGAAVSGDFGAGVYHDYISGDNLLAFKGSTFGWDDWLNNIQQALFPPAEQYTLAMGIARGLSEYWIGHVPSRPC